MLHLDAVAGLVPAIAAFCGYCTQSTCNWRRPQRFWRELPALRAFQRIQHMID
jgi:hypothetical protein